MVNVTDVNAWRIQNMDSGNTSDLLTFVRSIARHYLRCFEKSSVSRRRTRSVLIRIVQHEWGHVLAKLKLTFDVASVIFEHVGDA